MRWSTDGEFIAEVAIPDVYVTCIAWMPSVGTAKSDVFAISCTDGTVRLMAGAKCREEKKVAAHHGAALKVLWNTEGSALFSAGEDGDFKVFSKSGNLRSTPIKSGAPMYAVAAGPGVGEEVVYTCGRKLHIAAVGERKTQAVSWNAHEATVLCVSWSAVQNRIISGGEDCRYKVWDTYGRQLYQSQPYAHVITAVAWSPNGAYFAVGAYNLLRLCDKTGWSCSREQPASGSIHGIAWAADGTQVVGCGGTGAVVFGQLVDRRYEAENLEATLVGERLIQVHDVVAETYESLDFNRSRVVEMALGFGHLVVSTTSQCFIYSTHNWTTPYIFDAPEGTISMIVLAAKHFLVMAPSAFAIYAYDGPRLSQPRFPGMRTDSMSRDHVALAPELVAFVDSTDRKTVRCFDVQTGRPLTQGHAVIEHKAEISLIALNQHSASSSSKAAMMTQHRQLVLIDRNRELHIFQVTGGEGPSSSSSSKTPSATMLSSVKLATQVDTAAWNSTSETLCAVADSRLLVWAYPQITYTDRDLLPLTVAVRDASDLGKLAQIVSFSQTRIAVRRADGALMTLAVAPYPAMLHDFAASARWDESTRLCRFVDDKACWATLAGLAIQGRNLDVAELALAAIGEVDKLEYILYIKSIPGDAQAAELALYKRQTDLAEKILLQAQPPLLYRAIKLNIRLFKWDRALELAVKHRSHVDTVLAYRAKHLMASGKQEMDDRFKQLAQSVQYDWAQIKAKKELEKQEEAERHGVKYAAKKSAANKSSTLAPNDGNDDDGGGGPGGGYHK